MKRFILNAIWFLVLFVGVLVGFDYLSMRGGTRGILAEWTDSVSYLPDNDGLSEIQPYIERAGTRDGTTKLIIGDSVCHQIFAGLQEHNRDFSILGSNAAITMTGQYLLAREYLDAHPDATDVFLMVLPGSLGRSFDTIYSYQYVVMPFVETDTLKYLDQDTIDCLGDVYGTFFLSPFAVRAIHASGVNKKLYLNYLRAHSSGYVLSGHFELADRYVTKISEMCSERGVDFHLYPCPVSEAQKETVEGYAEAFKQSDIYRINPDFLDMVSYFPAEQSEDGSHFSGAYATQECFNEKIRSMLKGCRILDMLKFE